MRFGGWRFLVFAVVGVGAIVLLASLGTPGGAEDQIDRHTGERIVVVRTVADALFEARATGAVRPALELIGEYREKFPDEAVLERMDAILSAELAAPDTPPPPAHPAHGVIVAEQERAAQLRTELDRRVDERLNREALLALLTGLEADEAVASAVEDYFAPLARWPMAQPLTALRVDEMAVRLQARIEAPEAEPVPDNAFLEMVRAFRSRERHRGRMRWLLRTYGAFPQSAELRDMLLEVYLEHGRLREAFLVVGLALQQEEKDLDLWRRRAQIAGWLELPAAEAEAREVLLEVEDGPAVRERLITLYRYVGRTEDAIPHARFLARGSDDPAVLERPAQLALEAGLVDRALDFLDEIARHADDPAPWREKIVRYAWQDLRVERVIHELQLLRARYPDRDYETRLEGVYRRCHMPERLAELLARRLEKHPDDKKLEKEVLALYASLGRDDMVRAIVERDLDRHPDPLRFFENLATYAAIELDRLDERALAMADSDRLETAHVEEVLARLRPFLKHPGYLRAAEHLAHRFPHEPDARALLLQLADRGETDAERAEAVERLVRAHPDGDLFVRAWMDRASWAGMVEKEVEAREMWVARNPDDDESRRLLAEAYGHVNRPRDAAEQWRFLVEREGLESQATLRLIDSLMAAGELEEAVTWLEKRAALPSASLQDKLDVAEQLFSSEQFDRALRFYVAVLDLEPQNAHSLLRIGQIRSWTNDPRGAIPFFEQRLKVTNEKRAEVRFYLGEAHWSIHDETAGKSYHEQALAELEKLPERNIEQDVMVAKMLARFGRLAEAQPIFERVLELAPGNIDIILDYADSMTAVEKVPKARELVDRAKSLQEFKARTMRLDGKVLILERRYEEAAAVLTHALERYGPDAGTESSLGRAQELSGLWRPAEAAYRRALALQPENRDVQGSLARLADQLAKLVHGNLVYRQTGDDHVLELWAAGSMPLDEHWRVGAAVGAMTYSGRAEAVDGGNTDVEETVARVRLSGFGRFGRAHRYGGGIDVYAGAPGDTPVGAWFGLTLLEQEPYRTLELKAWGHLLFDEPAAAVGLGGRTTGARLRGQQDVGRRFWAAAEFAVESLSLELAGSPSDQRIHGAFSFGWRIREGSARVAERLRLDESNQHALVGPNLTGEPQDTAGPLVSAWLSYQPVRLLGDQELAALIPLGTDFDYLVLGGRGDFHLAHAWGAKVEGYLGVDLQGSQSVFGVEGGVTWRPSHNTELTVLGGYGTALGRAGDADSFLMRLGLTHRW